MLKKRLRLFLGLIVLTGSAYVTPTYASSAPPSVVIASIQPAGLSGAKEEAVALYNNGPNEAIITNWCLANKTITFYCLKPPEGITLEYALPGYSYAVITSKHYANQHSLAMDTPFVYEVTSQTRGSLTGSSDVLSLVDKEGVTQDSHSWSAATPGGSMLTRKIETLSPVHYFNTGGANDWMNSVAVLPPQGIETRTQSNAGTDPSVTESSQPVMPLLTELLPNPSGADEGREFIELYNPSATQIVVLDDIRLQIGTTTPKIVAFQTGTVIEPLSYRAFYSNQVSFTLPNTAGAVQLIAKGQPVGLPVSYVDAKDDQSWALKDKLWQYTSLLTPGAENNLSPLLQPLPTKPAEATGNSSSAVQSAKTCAEGSARNPATGRCKKTVVPTAKVAAVICKAGYERNSETSRCRKQQAAPSIAVCKDGKERNSETNRCRTVAKMSVVDHAVKNAHETASAGVAWYAWVAIGGIVAAIVAYGIWEWRVEMSALGHKLAQKFTKRSD